MTAITNALCAWQLQQIRSLGSCESLWFAQIRMHRLPLELKTLQTRLPEVTEEGWMDDPATAFATPDKIICGQVVLHWAD
jgi:hypothetical protein